MRLHGEKYQSIWIYILCENFSLTLVQQLFRFNNVAENLFERGDELQFVEIFFVCKI